MAYLTESGEIGVQPTVTEHFVEIKIMGSQEIYTGALKMERYLKK